MPAARSLPRPGVWSPPPRPASPPVPGPPSEPGPQPGPPPRPSALSPPRPPSTSGPPARPAASAPQFSRGRAALRSPGPAGYPPKVRRCLKVFSDGMARGAGVRRRGRESRGFRWRRSRRRRPRLPLCLFSPQPRQVTGAPPQEAGPRVDSAAAIACVAEAGPRVEPEAGRGGRGCACAREGPAPERTAPRQAASLPRLPFPRHAWAWLRAPVTSCCPACRRSQRCRRGSSGLELVTQCFCASVSRFL